MFHILYPKELRSTKQSIPSRKLPTTFRDSACSLSPYAPRQVPNSTCVPPSTSASKHSFGNALRPRLAAGRPNADSLPATSATSGVLPSMLTVRHWRYHIPRVPASATGLTSSSCKRCNGSYPDRVRAREIPASPAKCTFASGSASHSSPSTRQRSTSRADDCMYSARATTKYTITWAGNARGLTLDRSVERNTSSIRSGGKVLAITPRLI